MTDDQSVGDSTALFRRIHPSQVIWDENLDRLRPTSAAFRDKQMSVNLEDDLEREGLELDFVLRDWPQHHLASIEARLARDRGQEIQRDHTEDDPTHGIVVGQKSGSTCNVFARESRLDVIRNDSLSDDLKEKVRKAA